MTSVHSPAPRPAAASLEVIDLECVRGERVLFEGLGFGLRAGEAGLVEGPNGSGKTTLLRTVCGLLRPEAGEIRWRGATIDADRLAFQGQLHYLGHATGIKEELSARQNLAAHLALRAGSREVLMPALDRVGLEALADVAVRSFSAGQRRRLALARMLCTPAALWVLDEPFTALDRAGVALVQALIEEHCAAGGVALLSSHQQVRLRCAAPAAVVLT